jgi:hypothetical protein
MFNTFYESTCSGARGSLKAVSCCAIALGLPATAHTQGMLAITGLIDGGLAFVDDTGGSQGTRSGSSSRNLSRTSCRVCGSHGGWPQLGAPSKNIIMLVMTKESREKFGNSMI